MTSPTTLTRDFSDVFPDEVVTHAHVRDVDLPHGAGTMALITLDNGLDHTRPNSFGPQGLAELDAAIESALAREDVAAIGITGKPFILAAGADISGMPRITRREQAKEIARYGHEVFGKLDDGRKPSFGFVNGLAIGGGLEVALNCTYRTVIASAPAVAFSECFLGILPGWGGTWLLPNLVGADRAVKVIVENALNNNRMLRGPQVQPLGIADATFEGADFLERSLDWAGQVLSGRTQVERAPVDRGEAWDAAVARGRAFVDAKLHGAAPAAQRALDIIAAAKTCSKEEGLALEDDALADLLMSEEFRSGLYAFDLVQRRAKKPVGVPDKSLARPVTKVGIVGTGLMASQLALLFARRLLVPVVLTDIDDERVEKGLSYVRGEVDKLAAKGRVSGDQANRIKALVTGSTDKGVYADCDFVLEAVFEEMKVKQQVFAELEGIVSPECVLATNTSSLSVTTMASKLTHPERVVGFHFFNPVAILPLLEVVRGQRTDDASLATAFATAKGLKKNAILVKDAPAFVVNRILTRFMGEVTRCVDEGTPVEVADQAVLPLGLPMTPFVLLQLVGPAVGLHVAETLHEAFPDRFYVSPNLQRLVAANKPGLWSWDAQGKPFLDDDTRALLEQGDQPSTGEQVRERAMAAVADEVRRLLDDGVVADAPDVDLAMLLGAGWPFHLGGITPYLDRSGIAERVGGRRFLPVGAASLPA
ncbi:3-hydroxyacyl-CoA dehydrogenase [Actinopolymorpha cephalotaxi]|uniref:3-hydroxyacyl-CoA dehydrogenase n=1 Tax=Actinopolymorpha cephalotaxi TaxID=504797 RepID=A0A1I2PLR9_9ACTN|nr:3-hydroxyacyl-CoA dehydrogenase NAD-binding domain-containing protein [Actinopolymorpha cephalotaxi]NYH83550.1 3-hydroxyacyl-CoA dehydrogenase/enoyl-CoA hydratase/carnithine racemase [Actinopolymorpha cephalotaxi]SFG17175.1 3-hydroxyacyl-CoA dehydrogenase [Actinopolymorpha cephalotaxi]